MREFGKVSQIMDGRLVVFRLFVARPRTSNRVMFGGVLTEISENFVTFDAKN
jgi:hypothetical protein